MATNKPQPTEIREFAVDRERRGITDAFIDEQLARRKRQLAIPGFREKEQREERVALAKSKQKRAPYPDLARGKSTRPALVKRNSITGRDEVLLSHIL